MIRCTSTAFGLPRCHHLPRCLRLPLCSCYRRCHAAAAAARRSRWAAVPQVVVCRGWCLIEDTARMVAAADAKALVVVNHDDKLFVPSLLPATLASDHGSSFRLPQMALPVYPAAFDRATTVVYFLARDCA